MAGISAVGVGELEELEAATSVEGARGVSGDEPLGDGDAVGVAFASELDDVDGAGASGCGAAVGAAAATSVRGAGVEELGFDTVGEGETD